MRLFSDCSLAPLNILFNVLGDEAVSSRWVLQRVHTGLGIGIGIVLGTPFAEAAIALPQQGLPHLGVPYLALLTEDHDRLKNASQADYIRDAITCPTDIADLVPFLLRDLPSYANRVSTRAQVLERAFNPRGVVIAAAQTENDEDFSTSIATSPLLSPPEEITAISLAQELDTHSLTPLFFTTLERQYVDDQAVRLQHYHWAFLSQTFEQQEPQWHLALMFSRLGDYPADQPVTPPRESRQGSIGQALQLWLRDCNAGSVAHPTDGLEP